MGQVSSLPRAQPKRLRTITPPPPFQAWAREVASLEEVGAELAVVFWRVLRRVRAWAESAPGERAGLFGCDKQGARERLGDACAQAPGLVEAFGTFALLIRAPEQVEARRVAEACHQVYEWAESRSLLEVAMLFAEAAAIAEPENPAWANDAGRMCRRAARDERASSWYHRGYGLGVRFNAPEEVIRAQIGYGNLMKDLGQHEEARRYFERAARRAFHTGRRRQSGEAHHSLLTIAAEQGQYITGERHVRRALDLYPARHFRLPALAHDWAVLLITSRFYSPAIRLLDLALPRFQSPGAQLIAWSNLARAVAGTRQLGRFKEAESQILTRLASDGEFAPAALNSLAIGAQAIEKWDEAERCASLALDMARTRKDGGEERVASNLLVQITARRPVPSELNPPNKDRLDVLISRFDSRLRKWKAPDRTEPGAYPTVI